MKLLNKLYLHAPMYVKRILANVEAIRRDYYRQPYSESYNIIEKLLKYDSEETIIKFNYLISYANKYIPYYKDNKLKKINNLNDISKLPVLKKDDIRKKKKEFISTTAKIKRDLWKGKTSGSTGTPLEFYKDRDTLKYERNSYNEFYKYLGCNINENHVRFSGIKIVPFSQNKPPYFVYIDKYKQLQCSVYHINNDSFEDYLMEFSKRSVEFGTGYPSAWTALAEIMLENNVTYDGLKVIITDSEGLSQKDKNTIEKAFNCRVYRTYGLGEVGLCAVECENENYHTLPTHFIETIKDDGTPQEDGIKGELVVTDYNSEMSPYIRYNTGDLGILNHDNCGCKFKTPYISEIIGRVEDYVITKDGRKITRISKSLSYAVGVKKSQIIQESLNEISINIIADFDFNKDSMNGVISEMKQMVGNINIRWQLVEELERTSNGKIKFIIRRF